MQVHKTTVVKVNPNSLIFSYCYDNNNAVALYLGSDSETFIIELGITAVEKIEDLLKNLYTLKQSQQKRQVLALENKIKEISYSDPVF